MILSGSFVLVASLFATGVPYDTIPAPDTVPRISVSVDSAASSGSAPADLGRLSLKEPLTLSDTLPRRRASVAYSDAYGTRAKLHRRLSYAMVPLFAISYFTGDKLFKEVSTAPDWVRNTHRVSATSVAVLFTANTITGGWNMWEGRHDPTNRKRRLLHSALFIAASAGFTYSGAVLSEQAERSVSKRRDHRNLNLVSMGLSVSSAIVMLTGRN